MKRTLSIIIALALLALVPLTLGSCGDEKPIIGIMQFGSHASLNNCYTGITQALESAGITAEGYTIERIDSNFDPAVAQTQANTLVNRGARIILAIATPSAVAAANAALNAFTRELLGNHIRTCVAEDIRSGKDETIDELLQTLQKLMK